VIIKHHGALIREKKMLRQFGYLDGCRRTYFYVGSVPALPMMVYWEIFRCNRLLGCLEQRWTSAKNNELQGFSQMIRFGKQAGNCGTHLVKVHVEYKIWPVAEFAILSCSKRRWKFILPQ
jgi:hypothetical protein